MRRSPARQAGPAGPTFKQRHRSLRDGLEFRQAGPGHLVRILFPVAAVEQFQRNKAGVIHLAQDREHILERCDAVAGIDAIRVRDLRPRRSSGNR